MHGSTHGSEPAARKASRHDRHIERQRFLDGVHAIVVRGAGAAAIIRDIDFREAIAKSGITPPSVIEADGRLHRFATNGKVADKAGWYSYFSDGIPAGAYGCWRSGTSETWRADIGRALTTAEEAAHRAKVEAMRREREAEEIRRHTEAREMAVAIWKATTPAADDHPYLARKGVKAHGRGCIKGRLSFPCATVANFIACNS